MGGRDLHRESSGWRMRGARIGAVATVVVLASGEGAPGVVLAPGIWDGGPSLTGFRAHTASSWAPLTPWVSGLVAGFAFNLVFGGIASGVVYGLTIAVAMLATDLRTDRTTGDRRTSLGATRPVALDTRAHR